MFCYVVVCYVLLYGARGIIGGNPGEEAGGGNAKKRPLKAFRTPVWWSPRERRGKGQERAEKGLKTGLQKTAAEWETIHRAQA